MRRGPSSDDDDIDVPHSGIRDGLELLFQGYKYSRRLGREVWDFAVEISCLHDAKLTVNDLRWLICQGWVEHAAEVTVPGNSGREFRPTSKLSLSRNSCFVLTESGVRAALQAIQSGSGAQPVDSGTAKAEPQPAAPEEQPPTDAPTPTWDADLQELRVGPIVVKAFKLPSPNQGVILSTFEEDGWPVRIDDPLPPAANIDPKRRLHDAIKGLNRNQRRELLRFRGDGTGEGIRWEFVGAIGVGNHKMNGRSSKH